MSEKTVTHQPCHVC